MNSLKQELLGITIDSNDSFEKYVNNICKKASQKLNPLARISSNDSKTKSNHETIYYFAV